jgi:hypothetical protein
MGYSGALGTLIHEKKLKSKILWHCLFNCNTVFQIFSWSLGVRLVLDFFVNLSSDFSIPIPSSQEPVCCTTVKQLLFCIVSTSVCLCI